VSEQTDLPSSVLQRDPLLATKLYVPPVRSELISRLCLIERLNAGLHRKLSESKSPLPRGGRL